jgi:hypothetical protein
VGPQAGVVAPGSLPCPLSTLCVAAGPAVTPSNFDQFGEALTFDPTDFSTVGSSVTGIHLIAAACSGMTQCAGVNATGGEQTWNPQTPAPYADVTPLTIDPNQTPTTIACSQITLCDVGDQTGGIVSFDPADPAGASRTTVDPGQQIAGLSCPTSTQCTAVDPAGDEVTFAPADPAINGRLALTKQPLESLSCPSCTLCVAGGAANRRDL